MKTAACTIRLTHRFAKGPITLAYHVLILVAFAWLVRLPYLVPTVIHWHESTYIILGQDILNGHLPHTVLSELKPPFAALPYSLFIVLFGKSIAAIRIGGTLCVLSAALLIYCAGRKLFGAGGALLAGMSLIAFATTDSGAGATLLEHVALVPLACMVLLLSARDEEKKSCFSIGLAIGLAATLKTNLALFALAPLLAISSQWRRDGLKKTTTHALLLLLGLGVPCGIICSIYLFSGNLALWWHACVLGPIESARYHRETFFEHLPELSKQAHDANLGALLLCWLLPVHGLLLSLKDKRGDVKSFMITMATCVVSGFATMLAPGVLHARRYYIALLPFTAAMSVPSYQWCVSGKNRLLSTTIICTAFLIALLPVFLQYKSAWQAVIEGRNNDSARQVADYLQARHVSGTYVYFHTAHIGYWLTGANEPTRFVHPTDMDNPRLLAVLYKDPSSPQQELETIFAKKPHYVVDYIRNRTTSNEGEFTRGLDRELSANYRLEAKFGTTGVFSRTKD